MSLRKALLPQLESLESKTVMSAGVSTAPIAAAVAHGGPDAATPHSLVEAPSHRPIAKALSAKSSDKDLSLTGVADGYYTSTQRHPDTSTRYHLTASGTIAPIGAAVVTGSFRTPASIRDGHASGTLRIVGSGGTVRLKLRPEGPIVANSSTDAATSINPGGPIRGLKPSDSSTSSGPVILVNDFAYTIVRGTGQYAGDRGFGIVQITTTPGTTPPPGTGIYSAPETSETGFGSTTVTFESGIMPLA